MIWSNLLKKSLMENFIFCAVLLPGQTVVDVILQLTCYNALHLVEWTAKIQIFGVNLLLNEFTFRLLTSSFYNTVHAHSYVAWCSYGQNS